MREMNKRIIPADQPRVRNASPFFKNQQGKRFGIDGAVKHTSLKEMRAEREMHRQSTS
jgi:hypothetical protein